MVTCAGLNARQTFLEEVFPTTPRKAKQVKFIRGDSTLEGPEYALNRKALQKGELLTSQCHPEQRTGSEVGESWQPKERETCFFFFWIHGHCSGQI